MPTSRERGIDAESACCTYLQQQGLKLLAKNYRSRRGELDLVMQEKDIVVFIEVRYRKNDAYGGAIESITQSKQQKLRATAEQYLQQETSLSNGRFDVVAMTKKIQNNQTDGYTFDWIKNAF